MQAVGGNDVVVIFGRRGHGKTTVSKKLQEAFDRLVIIDRLREYRDKDAKYARSFQELSTLILESRDQKKFKIIFQFEIEHDEIEFNEALRLIYYRGDLCLVVEEVHHFASPHTMPSMLKEILLTGRHQNIALIATTQRPGELHKTLLSQAHHVFAGSVHETNDIKYLSGFMGPIADELSSLKKHDGGSDFIHFQPGEGHQKVFVKFLS